MRDSGIWSFGGKEMVEVMVEVMVEGIVEKY